MCRVGFDAIMTRCPQLVITMNAKEFERTKEDRDPDADFNPNVLNSAVWLLGSSMQMVSQNPI